MRRRLAGGGDGIQGCELTELYLWVGDVVDGDGRSRRAGGAQGAAAAAAAGCGAPVAWGVVEGSGSFTAVRRS